MMTETEHDVYDRACTHYKKKYRIEKSTPVFSAEDGPEIIKEFWNDYFSGKPLYS